MWSRYFHGGNSWKLAQNFRQCNDTRFLVGSMTHLSQIAWIFLIFSTVWVARKFCGEKGILEIRKGFLNDRLWKHWFRYNANFKLNQSQCSLFMTVCHIFEISEDDHPHTVSHTRDHWWTLDFANAFVSPGVNSRGELVPSHGASRRRLGESCIFPSY
jgi:hypothetical protein